jgi:hypothetical protein
MLRPRAQRHRDLHRVLLELARHHDLHRLQLELVEGQIGAVDGLLRFRSAIEYRGVARHEAARLAGIHDPRRGRRKPVAHQVD